MRRAAKPLPRPVPARRVDERAASAPRFALAIAAIALLATAPLTGRAARIPNPASARAHTVIIEGMRFNPPALVVHRGDRITWINKDPFPHTVTATDGKFDSHPIAPDGSWSYVARQAGDYDYVCTLHPTMKGRLEVR